MCCQSSFVIYKFIQIAVSASCVSASRAWRLSAWATSFVLRFRHDHASRFAHTSRQHLRHLLLRCLDLALALALALALDHAITPTPRSPPPPPLPLELMSPLRKNCSLAHQQTPRAAARGNGWATRGGHGAHTPGRLEGVVAADMLRNQSPIAASPSASRWRPPPSASRSTC